LDPKDLAYGVLYNGEVEPQGTRVVQNILTHLLVKKSNLIFYDLGANTGYFGIMAAFLGRGKITTYAFEPVLESVEVERESIRLNRLEPNCEIFNVAVGQAAGEAEIFGWGSGTTLSRDFAGSEGGKNPRRVPVVKLDDFVSARQLRPPDFIKVDIEGYELPALKGAQLLITSALPVIWYESVLTFKARGFKNSDFFPTQEFLKKLGYQIFWTGVKAVAPVPAQIADGIEMYLALHPDAHKDLFAILDKLYDRS
jgi:FkbM family methyltransferase